MLCKLKAARDLYDVIKPVYFISKILGLAPFKLSGEAGNRQYESGAIGLGIFRIIVIIGTMCYVGFLTDQRSLENDIKGLATRAELYLGTIMTSIVLFFAVIRQNTVIASLKKFVNIDAQFKQFGINVSYINAKKFAFWQIALLTIMFVSKAILQSFNAFIFIFIYNTLNLVDYINTVMLFQYVDSLLLLRQRFVWLNEKLDTITGIGTVNKSKMNELDVGFNVNILANIKETKQMVFKASVKPEEIPSICTGLTKDISPVNILQTIGKLHDQLCDISKMLNSAFSVQILATMAVRFIMTTAQLINIYKIAADTTKPFEDSIITICITFLYLFLHTSKMFMVAAISAITEHQAKHTGVLLHKIWSNDKQIKNYVKYFSLQMLHQNVKFTAAGFFNLDYTLVYAVVGAVTTYLVILIQFDLSRQQAEVACEIYKNTTAV